MRRLASGDRSVRSHGSSPPSSRARHCIQQFSLTWLLAALLTAPLLTAPPFTLDAHAEGPPAVHALTGARIVTAPGQVIENGTVVVRDGVIEALGAGVEPPADARVWDHAGHTIYAGLIDLYVPQSWPEQDDEGPKVAPQGVHATRETAWLGLDDNTRRNLRSAGFTAAVTAPDQGIFRGASALVATGEGDPANDLLLPRVAHHVAVRAPNGGSEPEDYPSSTMGAVALFRQTLSDAEWYGRAQQAYERNPAQRRPPLDRNLEALAQLTDGDTRVVFDTSNPLDAQRALRLAREFELQTTLVGHGHEYQFLDALTAAQPTIILPLDFPEPPPVGDADDPDYDIDLTRLRHWDAAPDNPSRLLAAGLTVALTSHGQRPAQMFEQLAKSIERGLTREQALAALTTTPAAWLGVSDRLGTLEVGKLAHMVVVDGDLWVAKPNILETWVDGQRYEIKASKPPEVDPNGDWNLDLTAGNGMQFEIALTIAGEPGAHTGSITTQGGQALELSSASVSGSTLEIAYDSTPIGMVGEITMSLNLEGDRLSGSGSSPMGGFTVTGSRSSGPELDRRELAERASEEVIR